MPDGRGNALGEFLRSRREKLSYQAADLASRPRRRTPGLRREEVAELAGIGVDWYIRLEQGRGVSPSVTTIDAVARALKLGTAEHAHLRSLARPATRPAFCRESVPSPIRRMVERLTQPAYVTGLRWDVLAWNDAAAEVFTDFGRQAEEDRNILLYMFTDPAARRLFGAGWGTEAKRMIATFRTTHDLWATDPAFIQLVERLQDGCAEFTCWWEQHNICSGVAGQKSFDHPSKGILCFEYTTFQCNDDPALKLVIYSPICSSGIII